MNVIETERLTLRHLTADDLDWMHAILGDSETVRYYPEPFSLEKTREWITWCLEYYKKPGYGLLAVILRETRMPIGDCGLTLQEVDGVERNEIGYHFSREHWGKGYASEAAAAMRDYAFGILKMNELISWMPPENKPSRMVAERIGMTFEKETTNRFGAPAVVYSIRRGSL